MSSQSFPNSSEYNQAIEYNPLLHRNGAGKGVLHSVLSPGLAGCVADIGY
jgi:hypothetical protein